MRTIKFRSYDPIKKEIWYPETIGRGYATPNLMQFTGLLDKFGKEIYEGDIVALWQTTLAGKTQRTPSRYEKVVHWLDRPSRLGWNINPGLNDGKHIEVIGNIYSNPELIN